MQYMLRSRLRQGFAGHASLGPLVMSLPKGQHERRRNIFKDILFLCLLFSFFICHADIPFEEWTKLSYQTNKDCFNTGIKRVFVPLPGIGTFACLKDAVKQLPEYEKSAHLLAGHGIGLVGASLATILALIFMAHMGIPGAKNMLGPELTRWFVKPVVPPVFKDCKDS